jgi:hypothetical protein
VAVKRRKLILATAGAAALSVPALALLWRHNSAAALTPEELATRYAQPLTPPKSGLGCFHLGHSLVGRDMPAMVQQLATAAEFSAHNHASQLGWGASLQQHQQAPSDIPGFDTENAHDAHRPIGTALASGQFDAFILTEMVEIRDAIKYHDSARALAFWAKAARATRPTARVYLYETWHELTDPEGWLTRIDKDLARYWEAALLRPAMAQPGVGTIHLIPGGQSMAAVARAAEAGQIDGLNRREDLFARNAQGDQDPIHFNDIGAYVVALTHFATLYHRSPVGLPHNLLRADKSPASAPSELAARAMQNLVWGVVTGYTATGVAG